MRCLSLSLSRSLSLSLSLCVGLRDTPKGLDWNPDPQTVTDCCRKQTSKQINGSTDPRQRSARRRESNRAREEARKACEACTCTLGFVSCTAQPPCDTNYTPPASRPETTRWVRRGSGSRRRKLRHLNRGVATSSPSMVGRAALGASPVNRCRLPSVVLCFVLSCQSLRQNSVAVTHIRSAWKGYGVGR
eukprot:2079785-Rhodomonas_salina.1